LGQAERRPNTITRMANGSYHSRLAIRHLPRRWVFASLDPTYRMNLLRSAFLARSPMRART
jgi:hypothetical protein